jgi:transcriptional regulator NrdR family protein
MTQVKKRDGTTEQFILSKIETGIKKAGATAQQAVQVAKEITKKTAGKVDVAAADLSDWVVVELRKVNKKAADAFAKFRDRKMKAKEENK